MKLFLLTLLLPLTLHAAPRAIDADVIKSSDHTKTWTMPSATGTLETEAQIQAELDALEADLEGQVNSHLSDAVDAHDASAISNVPAGTVSATDVQGAINEVATDAASALSTGLALKQDASTAATDSELAAHEADTTSIHGITDTANLLTTTNTKTVSGKTYTGAIVGDYLQFTNSSSPSTPSAGSLRLFSKSDDKLYYLTSAGVEAALGSGGGTKNFITNADAESSTTGWTQYLEGTSAYVDGTGGTPNATFLRSTSVPLEGAASFLFSPATTGNGVSFDLDVPDAYHGATVDVKFYYSMSNYTFYNTGDMEVRMYDRDTGAQLTPLLGEDIVQTSTKALHVARFALPVTGTFTGNVRVSIHQVGAAVAWALKFDEIVLAPTPSYDILAMNTVASTPATPASGVKVYSKTSDSKLYVLNSSGTETALGGGGGSQGIELQGSNGDAESGTTGWTNSGGTFTTTTTAANVGEKLAAYSYDASAGSQYVETSAYTIPSGLGGAACEASFQYKGGDSNLTVSVIDGSAVTLATSALTARTGYNLPESPTTLQFVCPAQGGTVKLKIASSADAAIIYFDKFRIGSTAFNAIAQATLFGSIRYAQTTNCAWTTTSASFANFAADTDCPAPTVTGAVTAPATKIPGALIANLPPGEYAIISTGFFSLSTTSVGAAGMVQFSDGTNSFGAASAQAGGTSSGDASSANQIVGRLSVTTAQSNVTIQVQGKTSSASNAMQIANTAADRSSYFDILIYRYPTASEQALKVGTEFWKVDANISGTNLALGNGTNFTTYQTQYNTGLTLANNAGTGNIAAQIICDGTNPPTGTTCSTGSEGPGISFTPVGRFPQDIEVCADFTHVVAVNASSFMLDTWQIVETASNSQTILQEGRSKVQTGLTTGAQALDDYKAVQVCGTFTLNTPGQRTFRVMYEQALGGTGTSSNIMALDQNTSYGQRDLHMTARPLAQGVVNPFVTNSVFTGNAGQLRVEVAHVAGVSESSACNSTPCAIYRPSTSGWVTVARSATGRYTATIAAGIFSDTPTCLLTNYSLGTSRTMNTGGRCTSATACAFAFDSTGGAALDDAWGFLCYAPR